MKKLYKGLLIITTQPIAFFPLISNAMNQQHYCETFSNKEAIHCAYMQPFSQNTIGKYIKIKQKINNKTTITIITCSANNRGVISIPSYEKVAYQPGDKISWQFSQCMDEDCKANLAIRDDNFIIAKSQHGYTSLPNRAVEIILNPAYGVNCEIVTQPNGLSISHQVLNSSLKLRINDAVSMLESIPESLDKSLEILKNMSNLAIKAAEGTNGSADLELLDKAFQTYKAQLNKVQRVNTLEGFKRINGGNIVIHIGNFEPAYPDKSLTIALPAFDQDALHLTKLTLLTSQDSLEAMRCLNDAITIIYTAMAFKITR